MNHNVDDDDDDIIDNDDIVNLDDLENIDDDSGYISKIGGLINIERGEFKGMVVEYSIQIIEDALPSKLYMLTVLRLVDLPDDLPIPKLPPDVEYDLEECIDLFFEIFPDADPEEIPDDDTCRELLSEEGMYDNLEQYPHIDLIPLLEVQTAIYTDFVELINMVKTLVKEKIENSNDPSFTRNNFS